MLIVSHTWECDFCEQKREVGYMINHGAAIPAPRPPDGWAYVQHMLVCPAHKVVIDPSCPNCAKTSR